VRTTLKSFGNPGFTGVSEGKSGSGKADCQKIVRGFQPRTTTSQNSPTLSGLLAQNPLTEILEVKPCFARMEKKKYYLFKRQGRYYLQNQKGKQTSLRTKDLREAEKILASLVASDGSAAAVVRKQAMMMLRENDPQYFGRSWGQLFDKYIGRCELPHQRERLKRSLESPVLQSIRDQQIVATDPDIFMESILRLKQSIRYHVQLAYRYGIKVNWVSRDLLDDDLWPEVRWRHFRAITEEEHRRLCETVEDPERRNYYELLWHIGASQGDAARLEASNIDWGRKLLVFRRAKLKPENPPAMIRIGPALEELLKKLPSQGPLFPKISKEKINRRSGDFWRRCRRLGFPPGCVLHSYRYAWIQRAAQAGMPERYAMAMMGHQSRMVHQSYAEKALIECPSLEEFGKK
jgi:integrase